MKRALEAHLTTVQALFDLCMEEFFLEHPSLKGPCAEAAEQVDLSCLEHMQQQMLKAQQNMLATLETNKSEKMATSFFYKGNTSRRQSNQ